MKFNKSEWVNMGQWVQPTLSDCLWNNWSQNNYPFDIPKLDGRAIILYGYSFLRKNDIKIIRKFINPNKIQVLEKWADDVHQECRKNINLNLNLIDSLKNFRKLYAKMTDAWVFFVILDYIITKEIETICKNKGYDFQKISQGIKPSRKPFLVQQYEQASKLYQKINKLGIKPDDIMQEIEQHVKEFEFCGVHHFVGQPYSVESFINGFHLRTKQQEPEIKIPEELKDKVKLACFVVFARTYMAETSGFLQHNITPKLKQANKILNLKENDYLWLSYDEIMQGLENPTLFKRPDIESRKQKTGTIPIDNKEIIISGKEVDKILEQFLEKPTKTELPLKGRIASKGKAIGIVKIVISPDDIIKVNKGDILVAPETTPDFVPAMRRAAGIITNRGGLGSHAAIVSREFNIPCLVGVKNATEILKDNQKIELDAEKGLITKQ